MALIILCLLLPVIAGASLPLLRFSDRKKRCIYVFAVLALELILAIILAFQDEASVKLFAMSNTLTVKMNLDSVSRFFIILMPGGYLFAGIFAFRYMDKSEHEGSFKESTFFAFYLCSLGVLIGAALAANLVSLYLFFEFATLLTTPLVLYERTQAAIRASLKYLFYSVGGAFMGLACIFILSNYLVDLSFVPGGNLNPEAIAGNESVILTASLIGVIGFGAKAGLYPLHGWLPTAHPEAPAPASAILSGILTKAGVLAILRLVYFSVGPAFLAGTWVQYTLLSLSLITVFIGSMLAYREDLLKKRLAFSSVSQVSYVLFGLFLLNPDGFKGGLMQIAFHAATKIGLFLFAGSIIYNTGHHYAHELKGCGKAMPKTFGAFTMLSLSLIGIPPFAGFVSKWFLASGSLSSGIEIFSWLGPLILIISALLTAGYLLPITVDGFFPGKNAVIPKKNGEGGFLMLLPVMGLSVLVLLMGIFSFVFDNAFSGIASGLF